MIRNIVKHRVYSFIKAFMICFGLIFVGVAFADEQTLGDIASNVTGSFGQLAQLITAGAYVAGFGFAVGAILKFKQHKDNPQQVTIGTPVALLFIAAALIFLPNIFGVAGQTLFGGEQTTGGVTGISSF